MKKTLALFLAGWLALACAGPGLAAAAPQTNFSWTADKDTGAWTLADRDVLVPAAYLDKTGAQTDAVVNGYCAATAPVLLLAGEDDLAAEALQNGYVVMRADAADLGDAAAFFLKNDAALPGDGALLTAVGSGEAAAAVAALSVAGGGLYAAVLYDPAVAGQADARTLSDAYGAALTAYLLANYQTSRQDGPNVVYTIDADGAKAYCAENAAGYAVDFNTLTASAQGVTLTAGAAGDAVIDPRAGQNASYYYIRGNSGDVSAASAALALGADLKAAGDTVNCAVSWGQEQSGALFAWLKRVCNYEVQYTSGEVETLLDLKNVLAGGGNAWKAGTDSYTISGVTAVANPELADYEGLSVSIPAAYVKGLDEDGGLIIDWDAEITTPNGAVYTAATAPIIINTGAAGYSSQTTGGAGGTYNTYGYLNVACGNRGKNNVCTDAEGNSYYTGDAPYCLVDQKAVVRWLKYNIGLGNLCGDADRIVSTGGSGGGAHSLMLAATGNHPDFWPYLEESGAVGAYYDETSGRYTSTVSDAIWGCCPYSPITNLEEADMAYEWESLFSDTGLTAIGADDFKTALSGCLGLAYARYVNALGLVYDLDGDGTAEPMTLNADGVSGPYADFLTAEATKDLEWFLDNIDAVNLSVTWDEQNGESRAEAYFYGHYRYTQSIDGLQLSGDDLSSFGMTLAGSEAAGWTVTMDAAGFFSYRSRSKGCTSFDRLGFLDENGDPNAENMEFGNDTADYRHWDRYLLQVLQDNEKELSALYSPDDSSGLYATYGEMLAAFETDVALIEDGDSYYADTDATIVELYNPLRYILDDQTEQPAWVRLVHGTRDKDVSLAATENDFFAWTMQGVNAVLYWSWDNVHVASDPLNTSKTSFIDAMAIAEDTGVAAQTPITSADEPVVTKDGGMPSASKTSGVPSASKASGAPSGESAPQVAGAAAS